MYVRMHTTHRRYRSQAMPCIPILNREHHTYIAYSQLCNFQLLIFTHGQHCLYKVPKNEFYIRSSNQSTAYMMTIQSGRTTVYSQSFCSRVRLDDMLCLLYKRQLYLAVTCSLARARSNMCSTILVFFCRACTLAVWRWASCFSS